MWTDDLPDTGLEPIPIRIIALKTRRNCSSLSLRGITNGSPLRKLQNCLSQGFGGIV